MILPACPFPPLSWYHLAYSPGSTATIEVHDNYIKQSIRNRILLANSSGPWDLTLPVHRRNADSRLIRDIIFTDQMNPQFILKNIKTAYGSAPFYIHFEDSLTELLNRCGNPGDSLLAFNIATIRWVESELGLSQTPTSSSFIKDYDSDLRHKSSLISNDWVYKPYPQVFEDRNGFISGRSILDAIFHGGPEAKRWWASVSLRD
jgi:hypothetical protein